MPKENLDSYNEAPKIITSSPPTSQVAHQAFALHAHASTCAHARWFRFKNMADQPSQRSSNHVRLRSRSMGAVRVSLKSRSAVRKSEKAKEVKASRKQVQKSEDAKEVKAARSAVAKSQDAKEVKAPGSAVAKSQDAKEVKAEPEKAKTSKKVAPDIWDTTLPPEAWKKCWSVYREFDERGNVTKEKVIRGSVLPEIKRGMIEIPH